MRLMNYVEGEGVKLVDLKSNDRLLAAARVVEVKDENPEETPNGGPAEADGSTGETAD